MIEIRELRPSELSAAIRLRVDCWQEELAGKVEHELSFEEELDFFTAWAKSEKEYEDRRILLGAFENEKLLGAAFGSFAEEEDGEHAMELNGLWVEEAHRGKGISLMLMETLIQMYRVLVKNQMVAYNHHFAPSNSYYRKLHGEVVRQVEQLDGQLLVDVFLLPFAPMEKKIHEMLVKHRDKFSSDRNLVPMR